MLRAVAHPNGATPSTRAACGLRFTLVPACGNKEVDARRPVDGQAGLEGAGWMHCTGRTLKLVMIRELAALAQIHPTRSRALKQGPAPPRKFGGAEAALD